MSLERLLSYLCVIYSVHHWADLSRKTNRFDLFFALLISKLFPFPTHP